MLASRGGRTDWRWQIFKRAILLVFINHSDLGLLKINFQDLTYRLIIANAENVPFYANSSRHTYNKYKLQ